jgi:hypothetical protein
MFKSIRDPKCKPLFLSRVSFVKYTPVSYTPIGHTPINYIWIGCTPIDYFC